MTIPVNKTLQENFKWRVELTPNNTAHKFLDRETTFKELDFGWVHHPRRSCQIEHSTGI